MTTTEFFNWLPLAALVCWGVLGLGRAFLFHQRGVRVLAVDRTRTLPEILVDLAVAGCLVLWAYEVIATALPSARLFAWPGPFQILLFDHLALKLLGLVALAGGLAVYAIALRDLGKSWRLGIDRNTSGRLVTEGIYAWSRHPIYVAFDLIFIGTFLIHGTFVSLALAAIIAPLLHRIMIREERFLSATFGEAYQHYRHRVARYLSFPVRAGNTQG